MGRLAFPFLKGAFGHEDVLGILRTASHENLRVCEDGTAFNQRGTNLRIFRTRAGIDLDVSSFEPTEPRKLPLRPGQELLLDLLRVVCSQDCIVDDWRDAFFLDSGYDERCRPRFFGHRCLLSISECFPDASPGRGKCQFFICSVLV